MNPAWILPALYALAPGPALETGPRTELGEQWIRIPARDGAPAFRCQVGTSGPGQLRVHVLPDPGADLAPWALQLWAGDPRMVERRKALLAESRKALKDAEARLQDGDHREPGCQDQVRDFLRTAREAQARIRDYDPFAQRLGTFGRPAGGELPQVAMESQGPWYAARFAVDPDVSELRVPALLWRLALVPAGEGRRRAVALKDLQPLELPAPWDLTPRSAPGQDLVRSVHADVQGPHLAGPDGYRLAAPGEVMDSGCFGSDPNMEAPDLWKPTAATVFAPPALQGRRVAAWGTRLALAAPGATAAVDLSDRLSGDPGGDWKLLDARLVGGDTVLLLEATSASRPGNPMGMCGAGEEVDLVWVRLDAGGRLRASASARTGSCWETRLREAAPPDPLPPGRPWTWAWEPYAPEGSPRVPVHSVTYDPLHPEQGLTVREQSAAAFEAAHPDLPLD